MSQTGKEREDQDKELPEKDASREPWTGPVQEEGGGDKPGNGDPEAFEPETVAGEVLPDAGEGGDDGGGDGPEPEPEETPLEKITREHEELKDKFLRLRADFENFRRRVAKEKADLIQYGNEKLLADLLPVIDNIERGLVLGVREGSWEEFHKGIELVLSEMHKTLSRYGVEAVKADGEPFDPNVHEAMQRIETDEAPPDTVVEEFQKGYRFRDRLLRPSLVAVAASFPEEDTGVDGGQESGEGEN